MKIQINSLDKANKKLKKDNDSMKQQIHSLRKTNKQLQEKNDELKKRFSTFDKKNISINDFNSFNIKTQQSIISDILKASRNKLTNQCLPNLNFLINYLMKFEKSPST